MAELGAIISRGQRYKLTREETETVIRGDARHGDWDVMTADPTVVRYLQRQGYELKTDHQQSCYVSCRIPWGRVRILKKEKRRVSDEARARMAILRKTAQSGL